MRKAVWVLMGAITAALSAQSVPAAQTGGLAAGVGRGQLVLSSGVSYAERDVDDGMDTQATTRRLGFRAQLGVMEGLDLYAQLGFADVEIDDTGFEGTLGGSGSLGVRYTMLDFVESDTKLMLDLQADYFRSSDGADSVRQLGYHVATFLVREFGAAGRTGYFFPYGGLRISYATYAGSGLDDFTSEDFIGVFGGADYFVTPNVFFTGEVHLFDETSLYLGVGYRF